jgi:CubicO group peptidase (beta-lactamase class C family)
VLSAKFRSRNAGDHPPAATIAGEYWPTEGWRTAVPADHVMDPAALATIERQVAKSDIQVRSSLIVRDGYLVYEHYWQGLDQTDGHDVQSVTKTVTGALIGIALTEGKIKSLDQTVDELLAKQLPKTPTPASLG